VTRLSPLRHLPQNGQERDIAPVILPPSIPILQKLIGFIDLSASLLSLRVPSPLVGVPLLHQLLPATVDFRRTSCVTHPQQRVRILSPQFFHLMQKPLDPVKEIGRIHPVFGSDLSEKGTLPHIHQSVEGHPHLRGGTPRSHEERNEILSPSHVIQDFPEKPPLHPVSPEPPDLSKPYRPESG